MKIYTKTGDTGETALLGGKRVSKSCIEMEAIGEVDELNGTLGILSAQIDDKDLQKRILSVQHTLFNVGANLAAAQTDLVKVPEVTDGQVELLEKWIDEMEIQLSPLTQFILPGGTAVAAQSFFVRAVCRRAERNVVLLQEKLLERGEKPLDQNIQKYLNRLSDVLFVLGRYLNKQSGHPEIFWGK